MLKKPEDLTTLMRAANRGDAAAYHTVLTTLATHLRAGLRRSLARINRGPEDVEDIVQETLLAVHLKRHTWVESEPLEPWVRAIAHNKMVDALRRRGFRDHLPIEELSETLCIAPEAEENAAGDCRKLLATLPARQRRVVEAMAIEGRSAREVASELGATEVTVRVTLHRALKGLARAFRREAS